MIISPLKVWVQNILPVVYDDSLSYLEIVAKINAKTNEIITQTNENTHAIETLAETIAELGDIEELRALLDEVETIVDDLYTTDLPLMDGTASAGSANHAARSDHVHPKDTSKAPVNHASSNDQYGAGSDTNFGHVKLSNNINNTDGGTGITPSGVKNELINVDNMLAKIVNENKSTSGATAGDYVIVINSTITGINNGVYLASKNIPSNTVIDATYLTQISEGAINNLKNDLYRYSFTGVSASEGTAYFFRLTGVMKAIKWGVILANDMSPGNNVIATSSDYASLTNWYHMSVVGRSSDNTTVYFAYINISTAGVVTINPVQTIPAGSAVWLTELYV